MATKIVTKNSSTASAVPTASDLVQGELAVNVADKRLFTEDNTGTIVELGTNPSTIDINAGSIDGTAIGASSASTGAFTTLTATGLTVDTNTLYVDSTNNRVGIGTTSPSSELHIASASPVLTLQDTDSTEPLSTYVSFKDSGGNEHGWMGYGSSSADSLQIANTHDDIILYTGSSGTAAERMRIDSSGNVGIGTSSPVLTASNRGNVTVNGSSDSLLALANADSYASYYYATSDHVELDAQGSRWMQFNTNGSERMRIDASGNVGIGMTPSARLSIRPSGSGSEDSHFGFGANRDTYISTSSTGTIIFRNASEAMRIDSSGRLLMGKTSATATGFGTELRGSQIIIGKTSSGTVNGIYFNHNSSYVGGLNYTNTATALATSSDQRLKENIADADDAGSKIDAIQVRKFDWKEDNSHQEYGFIAQELEQVFPYAVHTAQNEMQTKGVDYASLVPMMLKEIQSLRNRVAQLEE